MNELLLDEARDASHWTDLAHRLDGAPALLAATRAVGRGADRAIADALLARLPTLDEAARKDATQQASLTIHNVKRFGGGPDKVVNVALQAIDKGADASYLLRAIAQTLDQTYASTAALDVIRGTLAIAPPDRGWYEDTHALVLLSLARFDEARAAIDRLAAIDAGQAAWLTSYVTAMQQPFGPWYVSWFDKPADDAVATERPIGDVQAAVRAIASRIAAIRAQMVRHVGDAAWLPDVRALEPGAPDAAFDLDDNVGSLPNLVWMARREWSRLVWLLMAVGEKAIALPQAIALPPLPLDYTETILGVRFNLLVDRSEDKPFAPADQLDEQAGNARWGGKTGTMLKELAPHLANTWLRELSTALAAIRWAMGSIDDIFADQ